MYDTMQSHTNINSLRYIVLIFILNRKPYLLNDLYVPVNNDTLPTQVSDKKCGMENLNFVQLLRKTVFLPESPDDWAWHLCSVKTTHYLC